MIPIRYRYPKTFFPEFSQDYPGNEMILTVHKLIAKWTDDVRMLPKKTPYFAFVGPTAKTTADCIINTYDRVPIISRTLLQKPDIGQIEVWNYGDGHAPPEQEDNVRKFAEIFHDAPATMYFFERLTPEDLKMKNPRPERSNWAAVGFFDYDPFEDERYLREYIKTRRAMEASDHPKFAFQYIAVAREFCDRFNVLAEPRILSAINSNNPARIHRAILANNHKIEGRILVSGLVCGRADDDENVICYGYGLHGRLQRGILK